MRIPPQINGKSRLNGQNTVNVIRGHSDRLPPTRDSRIVLMMPDGTVLTVIGATRLVLGLSERSPTEEPLPA